MRAYYNEIDPAAAAWLRELIKAGQIAPGEVDERSIVDVRPSDLAGFNQCHFFAGIGVWSYALRRAGWPDRRAVWTGSCPCQPFSAAGKGGGFDDERHLWPPFFHLISECRPAVVLGEQVASKNADPWIDLVQDDMEAVDYAFGAVPFPSAGVGAPHIRDRTYWMANAGRQRLDREPICLPRAGQQRDHSENDGCCQACRLANPCGDGRREGRCRHHRRDERPQPDADGCHDGLDHTGGEGLERFRGGYRSSTGQRQGSLRPIAAPSEFGRLADADGSAGGQGCALARRCDHRSDAEQGTGFGGCGGAEWPGPTNGLWRDADWLFCRDGKLRPVEPGTFPLAHGAPARVGRLRGYGNAINAEAATVFIEACIDIMRAA